MYDGAIRELLRSFESRSRYLESIPAGDTVVVFPVGGTAAWTARARSARTCCHRRVTVLWR